jgi:hypothetical protein
LPSLAGLRIVRSVPKYEFPGVYVEEAGGSPTPIEGIPTRAVDPPTWADGPYFFHGIAIGGAVLAGLGISAAMIRGNVIIELLGTPAGEAGFIAILAAALVLAGLRALVEWRRRRAGRPPLRFGKLAFGIAVFQLAALVALSICLLALLVSLLAGPPFTSVLLAAWINVVVGYVWVGFAGAAPRDFLLLLQAARNDP